MKNSVSFKSDINNLPIAEKYIDLIISSYNISEEMYGNISISITEAVTNAILHGNKSDSTKNIFIESEIINNKLVISIKDEGIGFDYSNIPDPTAPENIEKINGRGIFLIKNLSDSLKFEDNGSKIIISFFL